MKEIHLYKEAEIKAIYNIQDEIQRILKELRKLLPKKYSFEVSNYDLYYGSYSSKYNSCNFDGIWIRKKIPCKHDYDTGWKDEYIDVIKETFFGKTKIVKEKAIFTIHEEYLTTIIRGKIDIRNKIIRTDSKTLYPILKKWGKKNKYLEIQNCYIKGVTDSVTVIGKSVQPECSIFDGSAYYNQNMLRYLNICEK